MSEDFENSILWIANLDFSPGFITDWFCDVEQVTLPLSTVGVGGILCYILH